MLTKTNDAEWSMVMKVKMQAWRMWDVVWYSKAMPTSTRIGGRWRRFLLLF
jgi:hypothetical protein